MIIMKKQNLFHNVVMIAKKHRVMTAVFALGLSIIIFSVISFSKIGSWSVWFDESFSVFMVKHSFADIWHYTSLDVNSPLYYFVLKLWALIFGYGDAALRSFSVVSALAVIVVGFLLAIRLFGRRTAYLSLPLLTLSPMLVRYATEIRCYTLLILILLLATYAFINANEKPSRKAWMIYGAFVALALWTHYYAALVIATHFIYRAYTVRKNSDSKISISKVIKKTFTGGYQWAIATGVLLFLPWIFTMVKQVAIVQQGFWIPSFSFDSIGNFIGETIAYSTHDRGADYVAVCMIAIVVILAITISKLWRASNIKLNQSIVLLIMLVVLPPLMLALLSMPPLKPMFVTRYVIFSMVMFSLLIAAVVGARGVSNRLIKRLQILLYLLVFAMSVVGVMNVLHYGNYNFDTNTMSFAKNVMSEINKKSSQNTAVISDSVWLFYDVDSYATEKNPTYFLDSSTDYHYGSLAMLKDDTDHKIVDLTKFAKKDQMIWYVSTSAESAKKPPIDSWISVRTILIENPINHNIGAAAVLYKVK